MATKKQPKGTLITNLQIPICEGAGCTATAQEGQKLCFRCAAYEEKHTATAPAQDEPAQNAAPINSVPALEENTAMESTTFPTKAESPAAQDSTIPTSASINNGEPATTTIQPTYQDATHPISVAVPRKDSAPKKMVVKRADHDRDVAYFDNVLRKRKDIARYVMPEYFTCPESWVPTLKLKQGESLSERLERDYNAWLKSYARALADRKVQKIGDLFFFPAKITPGGFLTLIREGKRAYTLAYAKDAIKIFGDDPRKAIGNLISTEVEYPMVSAVLSTARDYHREHGRKVADAKAIDSAMAAYVKAFEAACKALRKVNTAESDEESAMVAGALVNGVTA